MLNLSARYRSSSTPPGIPCREENFSWGELVLPIPVHEAAVIIIDAWDRHYIESLQERMEIVAQGVICPALEAARKAGMMIIHIPRPNVISSSPEPAPPEPDIGWPPPDFQNRKGEYAIYRLPCYQYPSLLNRWREIYQKLRVHQALLATGDRVVAPWALQELCKAYGILHLFYCGFSINWCILSRSSGIREMCQAGYNVMLIRDAIMGIEFPDTLEQMWATELTIREVEQRYGFSVASADFIMACKEHTNGNS